MNASAAASTSDVDVEERSILDDDDNEWCSIISSSGNACNLEVEAEEEGALCICICSCCKEAEDKDVVGGVNAVQKNTLLQIIATIQLAIIRGVMT